MFNKKQKKPPIPIEFLLQMGTYNVTIHGINLTAHLINCEAAVDLHVAELRSYLECNTKVVGLDVKNLKPGYSTNYVIVLCVSRRCYIIDLCYVTYNGGDTPDSLINFLKDPKICFVGVNTEVPKSNNYFRQQQYTCNGNVGVKVGHLAARVLKKPALIESSLADIAREVGVVYDGPTSATAEVKMDLRNPKVFTDEHVVAAVSDAYAYYQVGYKLLTSL